MYINDVIEYQREKLFLSCFTISEKPASFSYFFKILSNVKKNEGLKTDFGQSNVTDSPLTAGFLILTTDLAIIDFETSYGFGRKRPKNSYIPFIPFSGLHSSLLTSF